MNLELFFQVLTAIGVVVVPPLTMLWARSLAKRDKERLEYEIEKAYAYMVSKFENDPNQYNGVPPGSMLHRCCEELVNRGRLERAQTGNFIGYKLSLLGTGRDTNRNPSGRAF